MLRIMLEDNNQVITNAITNYLDSYCNYKYTDKDPNVYLCIRKSSDTCLYTNDTSLRSGCNSFASLTRFMIKVYSLTRNEEYLISAKLSSLKCPVIVLMGDENKMRASVIAEYICHILFTHFNIDSLVDDVHILTPNDIDTAKEVTKFNYNIIKDSNGKTTANIPRDLDVVDKDTINRSKGAITYVVRRVYHDLPSQKLYTDNLQLAVTECNKYIGYHVYDDTGRTIYTSSKGKLDASKVTKETRSNRVSIRTGNGIRIRNEKGRLINIPDGSSATIIKTIGDKSEIRVVYDKKFYTTMIRNDYLKDL
jgi:hypothetical protein